MKLDLLYEIDVPKPCPAPPRTRQGRHAGRRHADAAAGHGGDLDAIAGDRLIGPT